MLLGLHPYPCQPRAPPIQPPKVLLSVTLPCPAAGDVIGVLLNRVDHTISFTKNGMDLGVAFRDVREERLYPTVGMRTPDEEVLANFGSNSFRTNIEMLRAEAAEKVHSAIEHTQLPSKGRVRSQGSCHMYCCISEMLRGRHVMSASNWHVQLFTAGCSFFPGSPWLASSVHSGLELLVCSPCSLGTCWASWCSIIWSIRGTGTQQQLWHRTHWQAPSRCQSKTDRCRCTRQMSGSCLGYLFGCFLQACLLLPGRFMAFELAAVTLLPHSMLWRQLADAELALYAGGRVSPADHEPCAAGPDR